MSTNSPRFNTKLITKVTKPSISSGLSLINGPANVLNAHNAQARVLFLQTCKKSVRLPHVSFSNYVPKRFFLHDSSLETNLCTLCKNPNILQCDLTSIAFNRENSDRIKNIMDKILGEDKVNEYLDVVYETYINCDDTLDQRGQFRVFLIYAINNPGDVENEENWLVAFLIDPFHLVCPVGYHNISKKESMRKKYNQIKGYNEDLGTVFKKEFKNIDFKELNII
ncbi:MULTISPECIES: hypothetical protein [Lentilactobacillus]|uniref:Uncharacterized protein n=1 Tax=Lentilactobacillus kisonensis F0435 TaxID=797516 RepID=H1LBX2_9LACO|nr:MULTISPECIES: hypothetical protein [Lentilactobacillus]EHO54522.1 hypothetical protein HMPREF9104_00083 [Lentilactobacillus kisonensis F0435]MBV0929952.1 hypothetical protein [Lentilactobacillus dabitei]